MRRTWKVEDTVRGVLSIPKMGLKFVRPSVRSSVKRQDLRVALETVGCGGGETGATGVAAAVITVASGRVDNGRTMSDVNMNASVRAKGSWFGWAL